MTELQNLEKDLNQESDKIWELVYTLWNKIDFRGSNPGLSGVSGFPEDASDLEKLKLRISILKNARENLSNVINSAISYGFK